MPPTEPRNSRVDPIGRLLRTTFVKAMQHCRSLVYVHGHRVFQPTCELLTYRNLTSNPKSSVCIATVPGAIVHSLGVPKACPTFREPSSNRLPPCQHTIYVLDCCSWHRPFHRCRSRCPPQLRISFTCCSYVRRPLGMRLHQEGLPTAGQTRCPAPHSPSCAVSGLLVERALSSC